VTDQHVGVVARARSKKGWLLTLLELGVVVPTLAWIILGLANGWPSIEDEWTQILVWVLLIALVELMPVPMWRGTHIGMGFPLLMVVAFTYNPVAAAAAALLAA